MKKLILSLCVIATTLCASAQTTWYGNNPTFNDGFSGGVDYNGTATINGKVTFTATKSALSTVDVKPGAVLTLVQSAELYAGSTIEAGGTLNAQDHLVMDVSNDIAGTLTVVNTLLINNNGINLSGCGFVKTGNLQIDNDNVLHGSGLIYVTGVYSYQGGNDGPTQEATVRMNIPPHVSSNVGNATLTTATTSPCSISTPVTWDKFSLIRSKNDSTLMTISWEVQTESNVKAYTLQASVTGDTAAAAWDNVASIAPDKRPVSKTYTIEYNDPLITAIIEAGFGLLSSLLIIGLIVSYATKKHKVIGAICAIVLIICMVSCSKSNISGASKQLKYKYFRVIETDLDNTPTTSLELPVY